MTINEWLNALTDELDLADHRLQPEDVRMVLDLARDAAHGVQRPAAPLSAFLIGVAVGQGRTLRDATAAATRLLGSVSEADDPDQN